MARPISVLEVTPEEKRELERPGCSLDDVGA